MNEENNFDIVLFSKGDIVIAKNKEPDVYGNVATPKTISEVENGGSGKLIFQILHFDDGSFDVANNYEPFDPVEREQYYQILSQVKSEKQSLKKTKKKVEKPQPSVLTFDISKIRKSNEDNKGEST